MNSVPIRTLVDEGLALGEQAARVKHRHPRARARAAGRAIVPSGRDDDGVARALAFGRRVERAGEQRLVDSVDIRVLGMDAGDLNRRGSLDPLADLDELGGLRIVKLEAEALGVDDAVDHPAIRDIDLDAPESRHIDRSVQHEHEARHVVEGDAHAFAVAALGRHRHEPGRGLERELGDRLLHGDHARLEERRDRADGVGARHRHVIVGLDDHEACIGLGRGRRQHQVHALVYFAARLVEEELPEIIGMFLHILHLLEHGLSGHVPHPAGDDLVEFAAGMGAHDIDHSGEAHSGSFRLRKRMRRRRGRRAARSAARAWDRRGRQAPRCRTPHRRAGRNCCRRGPD